MMSGSKIRSAEFEVAIFNISQWLGLGLGVERESDLRGTKKRGCKLAAEQHMRKL